MEEKVANRNDCEACPVKKRKSDAGNSRSSNMAPPLASKQSGRQISASSSPSGSQDSLSPSLGHGASQPLSQPSKSPLQNCEMNSAVSKKRKPQCQEKLPSQSQLRQSPSEETGLGSCPGKRCQVRTRFSASQNQKWTSPRKASACMQSRPSLQSSQSLPSEEPKEPTPRVPCALVALPDYPGLTCLPSHMSGMVLSLRELSRQITEDMETLKEHLRFMYSEDPQSAAKPVFPVRFAYLGEQASDTSLAVAMIASVLKKMQRLMRKVVLLREHLAHSDIRGVDMTEEIHTEYKKNVKGMKIIQECLLGNRRPLEEFFDFYSKEDSDT